ncbi:MAG: ATP-binding protein [bacterium]|nr:ATP-binding protein [bacterium]
MVKFQHENNPNPARFLESYRYLGYDNYSAIADLVDNSFDADADNVWIKVEESHNGGFSICICDDGLGMSRDILDQAFRLGALTNRDPYKDLGKYGVGSASASLSIARKTTIITKYGKDSFLTKVVDLDYMVKENTFNVYLDDSTKQERDLFYSVCTGVEAGTFVMLENCDNIQNRNIRQFKNQLRKHIGQVFRMFLNAGKKMYLNDEAILPIDPLLISGFEYNDEKFETKVISDEYYELKVVDNGKNKIERVKIRLVNLPVIEKKLLKEKWPKEVDKPSIQSQGFYVLRNNREIAAADNLDLFTKHNDYNRFRAEIYFTATMDKYMGVNFTKRKVNLDQSIYDQLYKILEEQLETIRKILKRETAKKEGVVQESFRESEEIIDSKKNLLIRKKQSEEEIIKELEDQRRKHEKKTKEQSQAELSKLVDETGKPKECHFDVAGLGRNGAFFETERIGNTLVIKYNIDHPFYSKFYAEKDRSTQNDINFLVYSFVLAKRTFGDDQLRIIEQMEGIWSLNLKALLD